MQTQQEQLSSSYPYLAAAFATILQGEAHLRDGWLDYTRLVLRTPRYYPKIYSLTFKTLSLTEVIGWVTAWLQLGLQSAEFTLYSLLRPLLRSRLGKTGY